MGLGAFIKDAFQARGGVSCQVAKEIAGRVETLGCFGRGNDNSGGPLAMPLVAGPGRRPPENSPSTVFCGYGRSMDVKKCVAAGGKQCRRGRLFRKKVVEDPQIAELKQRQRPHSVRFAINQARRRKSVRREKGS